LSMRISDLLDDYGELADEDVEVTL